MQTESSGAVLLLTWWVLALGAIVSGGILLYAADLSGPGLWLLSLVFLAWSVSPYWFVYRAARRMTDSVIDRWGLLLIAFLLTVFGLVVYIDGFFIHLDAQNGLLFLFIPLWQWIFSAVLLALLALARRWKTSR